MNRISTNDLQVGSRCYLRGKVAYSHITSLMNQREMESYWRRMKDYNAKFIRKDPFYSIEIHDTQILVQDPMNPSLFDKYIKQHKLFETRSENTFKTGQCFRLESSGRLPTVLQSDGDITSFNDFQNRKLEEIIPEDELARDLEILLVLNCFSSPKGNNGVGLELVVLLEPIRYYDRNGIQSLASEVGFAFTPMSPEEREAALKNREAAKEALGEEGDTDEEVYEQPAPAPRASGAPVTKPTFQAPPYQPPSDDFVAPVGDLPVGDDGIRWD